MIPATNSLKSDMAAVMAVRLLTPFLNAALVVALARTKGPEGLGDYTFYVTIYLLFEQVKSCGLPMLLVRESANLCESGRLVWWRTLVNFGLRGALILWPILILAGLRGEHGGILPGATFGAALLPSAFCLASDALFLAAQCPQYSVWLALGEGILRIGSSLAVVALGGGPAGLALAFALSRTTGAVGAVWLVKRHFGGTIGIAADLVVMPRLIREAPRFFSICILPLALYRLDILTLGYLGTPNQVGIYSAGFRLFSLALILPDGALGGAYSTFSRQSASGELGSLRIILRRLVGAMCLILILAALAGTFLAPQLIRWIYGPKFAEAATVLGLLLWSLPLFAVNRAVGDALVAAGRQSAMSRTILFAFLVALVIFPVGIKTFGVVGTSGALVVVTALVTILTMAQALSDTTLFPLADALTIGLGVVAGLGGALVHNTAWRAAACLLALGCAVMAAWWMRREPVVEVMP